MKTSEANVPWDPKAEDQKVDGKNFRTGVDQLDRDVLRFLELIPDIQMTKVSIATNVAFPLASESADRALTKDDFLSDNAEVLLEKLGVPLKCLQGFLVMPAAAEDEETYKKIVCRYIGAHSKVPAKIPMENGVEAMELAVRATDFGFEAQSSDSREGLRPQEEENIRKAVAGDARMREVRSAVLTPKCWKAFLNRMPEQNANIPLGDLKIDKERFLRQASTKSYPLFGASVIKAVVNAVDRGLTHHQGAPAIVNVLTEKKYAFFDANGCPLEVIAIVDQHIQDCIDCCQVQKIKSKISSSDSGYLLSIPEAVEREVLLYADRRHQGFAEAYKRVKTWADFSDFKRKVV